MRGWIHTFLTATSVMAAGFMVSPGALACLDENALQTLAQGEMQTMLKRIPPAFADAVADGQIQGRMTLRGSEPCQVTWQLTMPAADRLEAQALLQADPAKQIMLAAQGYAIPEQETLEAVFEVEPASLQPRHQDVLQTAPLGKLRASVELMYAMLTQARADQQKDPQAWVQTDIDAAQRACQQQFRAEQLAPACQCYVSGMAEKHSARQVRYNQYLLSNPYAFATGNGAAFKQLDKSLQAACGLSAVR